VSSCFIFSGFAPSLSILLIAHDYRRTGGFCVVNGLFGLRHDAVVCRNNQDDNICGFWRPLRAFAVKAS